MATMSGVMYKTHHELKFDRAHPGSTAPALSLREQRRGTAQEQHTLKTRGDTIAHTDELLAEDGAGSRRHIRHSRSFSDLDMSPQKGTGRDPPAIAVSSSAASRRDDLTASGSKYSSYTVAVRESDSRRARAQRRKTDGADEIVATRRPSTSHGSTMRKVTYSQYPDFENIKDPFAKRDKIPRNHHPPAAQQQQQQQQDNASVQAKPTPRTEAEHGSGSGVLVRKDSKGLGLSTMVDHARKDSQEGVPTPLKKRDKIPRHAVNRANMVSMPAPMDLSHIPQQQKQQQQQQHFKAEPLQMEPMESPLPDSPQTPPAQTARRGRGEQPASSSSLVSPTPAAPSVASSRSLNPPSQLATNPTSGTVTASVRVPPRMQSLDTNTSFAMSPVSSHTTSPRIPLDMDKVDTLYARRSVIFEKNKQLRDSRERTSSGSISIGMASSNSAVSPVRSPLAAAEPLSARMDNVAEMNEDENEECEDKDDDDDHFIPFDQVLIPTAFKRLRAALEDPSFEIDEETYRRFKLSERWYVREERRQMEMTFSAGTFGDSKNRGRIAPKRLSQSTTEQSAVVADVAAPVADNTPAQTIPAQRTQSRGEPQDIDSNSAVPQSPIAQHSQLPPMVESQPSLRPPLQPAEPQQVAVSEHRRSPKINPEPVQYAPSPAGYDMDNNYTPISSRPRRQDSLQRGYVPPRNPEYTQSPMEPMEIQEPAFTHQTSRSRSHRRRSNTPPKKSAGCGMCTIM
ncbi:hypothetical protein GGI07_000969 [Coemansia sp. Benny D115]|nr:hypothetical protein GGI07_000969 [Coemansia sp. Benny D115]